MCPLEEDHSDVRPGVESGDRVVTVARYTDTSAILSVYTGSKRADSVAGPDENWDYVAGKKVVFSHRDFLLVPPPNNAYPTLLAP